MEISVEIRTQFNEKLHEARTKVYGSAMAKKLEFMRLNNNRYNEIKKVITSVTEKPVWTDFNFKSGKLMGILRTINQSPLQKDQILAELNLDEAIVDMYNDLSGNLPYVDNTGQINEGRPMQCEELREFLPIAADNLGILLEESDLSDITQERWDKLYERALERARVTKENNDKHSEEIDYVE